jgi:hypothetical protein
MAKPYSTDLRERVVAAVEKAGMSRRAGDGCRFRISASAPAVVGQAGAQRHFGDPNREHFTRSQDAALLGAAPTFERCERRKRSACLLLH